jgi:superfamily II DNA or RNA helicase
MADNLDFGLDANGLNEHDKQQDTQLRYYQIVDRNAILAAWERGCRSVMYQSPTGSGKTPTIASIVRIFHEKGLKTLTLAHREELVDNLRSEYIELFGLETGAIKAGQKREYHIDHQVASIGTYVNALDFNPDLIITDEGHHCIAKTYLTIYAAHPNARLLMVTATPYRLSGLGFTDICDELVLGLSVLRLEQMGNLVPAKLWAMTTYTHEQIAQVHIVKGEYSETEMSELLTEARQIMSVVDTYIEKGEGKQMMLYATSVEHSKKLVEAFQWRGVKAGHVDGTTKNRKEIFAQFGNKEIQILSNCEIATEGNNIPSIEIIGLARKTKSLSLYLQMVGRGSRPFRYKREYLLFDFVDNYWEHGFPNREHDWRSHFVGITTKEKKSRNQDTEERQFEIMAETGEIFISNLAKLPDGFRGQILKEVEPLNTKFAEALRKRQAKLDEINRRKQAKEAEIQRKRDEVERKKQERLDAIQRIKDAKLAEIQRRKDAKEAAIQRKIAEREAREQAKLAEKAAKLKRIEDAALAQVREAERREESWKRHILIRNIQRETDARRNKIGNELYATQRENNSIRREKINEILNRSRENGYSFWEDYHNQQSTNTREEKEERLKIKRVEQLHRLEIQFEIGIRMTHHFSSALLRMCKFCKEKYYEMPNIEFCKQLTASYITDDDRFTDEKFDEAIAFLETKHGYKIF